MGLGFWHDIEMLSACMRVKILSKGVVVIRSKMCGKRSEENKTDDLLLEVVHGFEIETKFTNKSQDALYSCVWKKSDLKFQLDLTALRSGDFMHRAKASCPVIYVYAFDSEKRNAMQTINSFNIPNGHLMIYDTEEDIQMFAKDFWNLLIMLRAKHQMHI